MCLHWCLTYLSQLRSPDLAHCVTSQGVGSLPGLFVHSLHLFHSSQLSGEDTGVGADGVAHW